jgi:hypothetical protein
MGVTMMTLLVAGAGHGTRRHRRRMARDIKVDK